MTNQTNGSAPSTTDSDASKALATLQDAASLVEKYSARLYNNERAQEFSTQISIMAQRNPDFKLARPESVVAAMMACVQLDLMPNTPQQHAHLIPYKVNRKVGRNEKGQDIWEKQTEIQFQLGYKGLIELAARTGNVKAIYAELVFEGDTFDIELGTERKIVHKPNLDVDRTDATKVKAAYMVAVLVNGERSFEVMNREQLLKIKESAKASSTDAPWAKWETEQMRKTVVKRGTKLLPSSGKDNRLQYAAQLDSWAEAGKLRINDDGQIIEGEAVEAAAGASRLSSDDRRARMAAAESKRKELESGNHKPKAVES
jgi:recombination protein RecT